MEGVQQDLKIEADRNILSKQDVLSVDYHTAYHVMGTKWVDAGDNPTNANLATANKWQATYDVDLIPAVQITVNTPLDTSTIWFIVVIELFWDGLEWPEDVYASIFQPENSRV